MEEVAAMWTGWWWSMTLSSPSLAPPAKCSPMKSNWSLWDWTCRRSPRVFHLLREKGIAVDASVFTVEQAVEAILKAKGAE